VVSGDQVRRHVVPAAAMEGIPAWTLSSALAYYDFYPREQSPANLIQAQRDYLGAHADILRVSSAIPVRAPPWESLSA